MEECVKGKFLKRRKKPNAPASYFSNDGQQSAGFSLQSVPPLARSLLPAPAERLGYGTETCADQYTEEMRGFGDVLRKSLRNAAVKSSPFLMREREAKILVEK